jgi:hypothetical protein
MIKLAAFQASGGARMKIHEIHCYFHAEFIVWWEWLPATILGFAKSSQSRLEAAPTTHLNFFSDSKKILSDQTGRLCGQRLC